MKTYIIVPALALMLLGGTLYSTKQAFAQSADYTYPPIVTKLAQRFNLKEAEVQDVFVEMRSQRQEEMATKMAQHLDTLVNEGKITNQQKQAILAKHEELKKFHDENREAWKNLTPEERKNKMEQKHQELQKWAQDNGIDPEYMMFKIRLHHGGAFQGERFHRL